MAAGQEDSTEITGTEGQAERQHQPGRQPRQHLRARRHQARDPAGLLWQVQGGFCY